MKLSNQYLAGFFDGEGCVYVSKHKGKKKNPYYSCRLSIANTDKRVIDLIEQSYGGFTQRIAYNNRPNRQPYYAVEIYKKKHLKEFIKNIRPYSIIKGEQLDLMLELIDRLDKSKSGKEVSGEEIEWRENTILELKRLKRPGLLGGM